MLSFWQWAEAVFRVLHAPAHLGVYTLDAEGVPLLIGARTLEKLQAIIDPGKSLSVMKAVEPYPAIPLIRSTTGHLLLNMRTDWMGYGQRIPITPNFMHHQDPRFFPMASSQHEAQAFPGYQVSGTSTAFNSSSMALSRWIKHLTAV